jgi:hypothetical protein
MTHPLDELLGELDADNIFFELSAGNVCIRVGWPATRPVIALAG